MEKDSNAETDSIGNSKDDGRKKPQCDGCRKIDYDKETSADRFCIKCEEKLCPSCSEGHKAIDEHLVVTLDEQTEVEKPKRIDSCVDHDGKLLELFCASCRKVICSECEKVNHASHSCSGVTEVADVISKQAKAEYEDLYDLQSHLDKEFDALSVEKTKFINTVKEMETEIRKRCDEITELVHRETKMLLTELDAFKHERLEEIERERRQMEEHAFTLKKFHRYCDQITRNEDPKFTCEAEGILHSIVDDLNTRPGGRWKREPSSVQFSLEKPDIEKILTSLAKLTIKCPFKLEKSSELKLDQKEIYGIERLFDKLYVMSDSISIRRLRHPFAFVGEIKTPNFKSPKESVACSKISCLYVHDKGEDCIWKISVPDHRVSRWLDRVKEPTSLSVTSNAEVLMLRNRKPVCIEVYSEYAIILRRIKLPATIPSLQSACETPCGMYIGLGEQNVLKFRADGSIIGQYAPYQSGVIPQCFELAPYHILLHCGYRRFNDFYTRTTSRNPQSTRILSLSLNITSHQDTIHTYDGQNMPVKSFYIKETKQLLVLEESGASKNLSLSVFNVLP